MAFTSLIALIDDIATILDDVAVMTKVAAKKTAGVLGDDLALNAQQVSGVHAEREIPVVWAVCKGSMVNKTILVPAALFISAFTPVLIPVLLMIGGAFLCYEGFEKVLHKIMHKKEEEQHHQEHAKSLADESLEITEVEAEKQKIKGAIRTDFILSAEIIVISLGAVSSMPILQQVLVLIAISLIMTIGVYGLVAGIVKLDDFGLFLLKKKNSKISQIIGLAILRFAPYLMKSLAVLGTVAMFMVGGSIVMHNIPQLANLSHHILDGLSTNGLISIIASSIFDLISGIIIGGIVFIAAVLGLNPIKSIKK
jgi:predicted DNA repair protein MutK